MFKKNKILFNLHFVFSCIFFLPILILAISGSILSYEDELKKFFNAKHSEIIVSEADELSVKDILLKFGEQKPDLKLASVELPSTKGMPIKIKAEPVTTRFNSLEYILNPYSGEIMYENHLAQFMFTTQIVHRTLAMRINFHGWTPYGRIVAASCTFVLMFIIVSGMYLYFPLIKHRFINSFKINFKSKGYRFLYDLHTTLGLWLSGVLLLISFTAIYTTFEWFQDIVDPIVGLEVKEREPIVLKPFKELISTTNIKKIEEIDFVLNLAKKTIGEEEYSGVLLWLYEQYEENRYYVVFHWDRDVKVRSIKNFKAIAIDMKRKRVIHTEDRIVGEGFTKTKMNDMISELHTGVFFGNIGKFIYCLASFMFVIFPITGLMMTYWRVKKKEG